MFCLFHLHLTIQNVPSYLQVIADIDSESEILVSTNERRSRYDKFIVIEIKYNRHISRRDREPSRIPAKKLSRLLRYNLVQDTREYCLLTLFLIN